MKKILIILSLLALIMIFPSVNASSEQRFSVDELKDFVPNESGEMLEDLGVDKIENSLDFDFRDLIGEAAEILTSKYVNPLKIMILSMLIIILSSFLLSFYDDISQMIELSGAVSICIMVFPYMTRLLWDSAKISSAISVFVLSSIPIYAVLLIAGGKPSFSGSFTSISMFTANVFTSLCNSVIIPFMSVFLGLSVSSVFSHINIKNLCENIYKIFKWLLISGVSIFSTIISMQSALSVATDKLASKTVKLIAGTTIPIVGTAFGEAVSAVQNSLGILKSGAGAFGILACLCIFLPAIIELCLWLFSFQLTLVVADFFSYAKIKDLMEILIIVIKILMAILMSFFIIALVISAITIFSGN